VNNITHSSNEEVSRFLNFHKRNCNERNCEPYIELKQDMFKPHLYEVNIASSFFIFGTTEFATHFQSFKFVISF